MTSKVRLVCATRATRDAFPATTALGRCLAFYNYAQVELRLFERNTAGPSACYNEAIAESAGDPAILVFVHDDVLLCDHYWIDRIIDASRAWRATSAGCRASPHGTWSTPWSNGTCAKT